MESNILKIKQYKNQIKIPKIILQYGFVIFCLSWHCISYTNFIIDHFENFQTLLFLFIVFTPCIVGFFIYFTGERKTRIKNEIYSLEDYQKNHKEIIKFLKINVVFLILAYIFLIAVILSPEDLPIFKELLTITNIDAIVLLSIVFFLGNIYHYEIHKIIMIFQE